MYAAERQRHLAERLDHDGRLSVVDLATELGVSSETIRRDLTVLERDGLAQRVHGGAVVKRAPLNEVADLTQREVVRAEQKQRIAQAATALLPAPGGSVVLDAGTTVSQVVQAFPYDRELTVVTHAIPAASTLATMPAIRLHLLGGAVNAATAACTGPSTVDAYGALRADVCFVATSAATAAHGLSTPDPEEAAVKRALLRSARQVVAVFDLTKLGIDHMFSFATYDDLDVVITDDGADPDDVDALRARGVQVILT